MTRNLREAKSEASAFPVTSGKAVPVRARDILDFFVFVSVHADSPYQPAQGPQAIEELVRRCVGMAKDQGISRQQLEAGAGNLSDYFRAVIDRKNADAAQRNADGAKAPGEKAPGEKPPGTKAPGEKASSERPAAPSEMA